MTSSSVVFCISYLLHLSILDTGGNETSGGMANLGSLGALAALNSETEIPPLPPSLAKYYNPDLIAHIQDLPGEALERQVKNNNIQTKLLTYFVLNLMTEVEYLFHLPKWHSHIFQIPFFKAFWGVLYGVRVY